MHAGAQEAGDRVGGHGRQQHSGPEMPCREHQAPELGQPDDGRVVGCAWPQACDGVGKLDCSATNIGELFSVLDEKFPQLKPHLRDEAGEIRRFLNVYVNEEDIRFLGGPAYAFQDGDEILLVPSIAGGTD